MRYIHQISFSLAVLAATVGPALAYRTRHSAPEIDSSAGIATLAVLVTAGIIAYTRSKR